MREGAMKGKQKIIVVVSLLTVVGLLLFLEFQSKIIRQALDDVLYDNRFHYISCEKLPSITEVEKVIAEHQDVIKQIEAVNPGFVGIEVNTCGPGNADITFWYGSHEDRMAVENLIGGDTFFGVPYNLQNR
jgi:hypothetical protein